ncbi:MAG: hypothetical protein A3C02_03345 [Candidatus Andersenbacteria bacterium RIFCSPHIGHO2_02_FULL_45_11]|uniref:PrgI family protein n=1 Tax=Candidatus Andersenbacteria bacterium RIFCSPHIGHO2_12_FULL_45_11 TaxID=1797281 RepID=A0A1G1X487_9BACT|nr:MAG: hypothetical protein A2805_03850 [Candidatus Andersenbacteria bacterium RIFCSPHIGHO2_01_FULL_46_36]OGY33472.1 MAG: hypothetical protein A3C02_03345 [Candidatus Andersenbacteria bacterium RIFCSPHIGHO2_02_FULL_45_11]OGY34835.1 MAG: hypothetical protein A3D99_02915 [Candidatus Andersenbacteria bacterium RIFCSPHIGHO2_12_FULL_45_11]
MRFQVPQFVDIEDKIIGPFTLRQFLTYVVAAMLLVPVYIYSDLSLFITIALPILGIAAVFAHLKIYGRTFSQVTFSAISYASKGQLYIWRRLKNSPLKIIDDEWDAARASAAADRESASLSSIAQSLETTGNVSKQDADDPLVV